MTNALQDYFDALARLKRGEPIRVRKGVPITNDSVSLEAGRKKGSIKRSRPIFSDLIAAIDDASKSELKPQQDLKHRLIEAKAEIERYRTLWEAALAREVSLVKQLWSEKEAWSRERELMSKGKVVPIRGRSAGD